jgi:phage FluMu protein Com
MENLKEYRCPHCRKLFFKGDMEEGIIEIKCKNCKNIHKIDVSETKFLTVNDEEASYEREITKPE